ncbi:MAG: PTS sugar transporter subunit IIA [Sulfurifustaceae bacterium]
MYIQTLLTRRRVSVGVAATTKQRLFECVGELLHAETDILDAKQAADALAARERLGSTGVGSGVALPHGRVAGLPAALGAFCTLERALDYGALDHKPVTMVFALLVPIEANEEHLKILAELAGLFANKAWRESLLAAPSAEELYNRLTHPLPARPTHDPTTHGTRSV